MENQDGLEKVKDQFKRTDLLPHTREFTKNAIVLVITYIKLV